MGLAIRPLHLLLLIVIMTLWGLNFVAAKIALEVLPPIFLMALRWGLTAVILAPFAALPKGRWLPVFLISVTLGLLHFSLMFTGLRDLDVGIAAIAIQLQVPFAALLAAMLFNDRLGWRRAAGMAIAIAGVAIIAGEPRLNGRYLALGMVILAACIWSVASIQIKLLGEIDGMTLNTWIGAFAAPQLLLASLMLEEDQLGALAATTWPVVLSILYQAILVVGVGYGLWFHLLRLYPVNQIMPFILLVPVVGVLSGVAYLGEPLTPAVTIGGVVTLAGVGIIILRRPRVASPETKRV